MSAKPLPKFKVNQMVYSAINQNFKCPILTISEMLTPNGEFLCWAYNVELPEEIKKSDRRLSEGQVSVKKLSK